MTIRPIRILLVEDDEDDYFLTRDLLTEMEEGGYSLDRAQSYEAGLEVIRQERHDIYLLDYRLNARTGVELMREALAQGRQAPMILLTGQGERQLDVEAMKAGAVDFLTKGRIDPPLLERSIRYAIERHRDQQALRQAHDDLEQRVRERTAELERANDALREGESRFRGMFEQAAVGMAHVGMDGRWLRVNQRLCDIVGYDCAELLQITFQDVTHPDDLATDLGLLRRLIDGEIQTYSLEKRYIRKDGQLVWINLTVALQRDDNGVPQYCISVVEDVSQRKQAEDALREAYRRKDEFLTMLAHELRNPLAPIRTGLQVLKLADGDRRALEQARAMMERQVGHMARIVDDLLDVSRVNNGKLALRPERLDLGRLVRIVAGDHRPAFDQAGLVLQTEAPETPVWVTGDRTRLTQVMDNLLTNAAKFTDRGGKVGVRLAANPEGRQAVLTVWDTGIGLDQDMAPRLFEPFVQADRSLDRSKGGLGLGLALVKGLVELHAGHVEAVSDGPGRGAEFTIVLPLEPEPAALSQAPGEPPPAGCRLRILLIEDNRDAAESLRVLLELYGHGVTVACTGTDGVKAGIECRPDVVVCDIGLPGLDGYGVAAALRRDPSTASIRIIAVTGYGSDEDRRRSQEAGFDQHLTKPVDPMTLLAVIAGAVPAASRERRLGN